MKERCATCGRVEPFNGCQWPNCPKKMLRLKDDETVIAAVIVFAICSVVLGLLLVLWDEGVFG